MLHSPIQQDVLNGILFHDNLPFAPALPIAIDPTSLDSGVSDVYIDDITGVFVDNPWSQLQARAVTPLAINKVG